MAGSYRIVQRAAMESATDLLPSISHWRLIRSISSLRPASPSSLSTIEGPVITIAPNEAVEKPSNRDKTAVFGGRSTLPTHEIVDCSAFYDLTFFCISAKDHLGDFFYSLNAIVQRGQYAARWNDLF